MTTLTLPEAAAYCDQNKPPGARWRNARRMLKYHLDNRNLIPLDARNQNKPVRLRQNDLDVLMVKQTRIVDTDKIDSLIAIVPVKEISKRLHVATSVASQRRQATGLPTTNEKKRLTAEAALEKLHPLNLTDQKIATEAGVSREMIQKMRKARGWPPVAEKGGNSD